MTVPVRPPAGGARSGTQRVLRPSHDVETVALGPNRVAFPLTGDDTGGGFSLTDFVMAAPPAPGPPPHIHDDADEAVYVLEGTVRMGIDEQIVTGTAGSVMLVPRGQLHSLENVGPGAARIIVVLSPPGYEGFWREMAEIRARLGGSPPDPETVLELQRKYQMRTGGEARRYE